MYRKLILAHIKLLSFSILPGILGGIAGHVGHHQISIIKALMGMVVGYAIQHQYIVAAIKNLRKINKEFLDKISQEDDNNDK